MFTISCHVWHFTCQISNVMCYIKHSIYLIKLVNYLNPHLPFITHFFTTPSSIVCHTFITLPPPFNLLENIFPDSQLLFHEFIHAYIHKTNPPSPKYPYSIQKVAQVEGWKGVKLLNRWSVSTGVVQCTSSPTCKYGLGLRGFKSRLEQKPQAHLRLGLESDMKVITYCNTYLYLFKS